MLDTFFWATKRSDLQFGPVVLITLCTNFFCIFFVVIISVEAAIP